MSTVLPVANAITDVVTVLVTCLLVWICLKLLTGEAELDLDEWDRRSR